LLEIIDAPYPQEFATKISKVLSNLQPEAIEASDSKDILLDFFGINCHFLQLGKVIAFTPLTNENKDFIIKTSNSINLL